MLFFERKCKKANMHDMWTYNLHSVLFAGENGWSPATGMNVKYMGMNLYGWEWTGMNRTEFWINKQFRQAFYLQNVETVQNDKL